MLIDRSSNLTGCFSCLVADIYVECSCKIGDCIVGLDSDSPLGVFNGFFEVGEKCLECILTDNFYVLASRFGDALSNFLAFIIEQFDDVGE